MTLGIGQIKAADVPMSNKVGKKMSEPPSAYSMSRVPTFCQYNFAYSFSKFTLHDKATSAGQKDLIRFSQFNFSVQARWNIRWTL